MVYHNCWSYFDLLLDIPQSQRHILAATVIYVAKRVRPLLQRTQTWDNVAKTGQNMTKRELDFFFDMF
jgi:hypothetical protein